MLVYWRSANAAPDFVTIEKSLNDGTLVAVLSSNIAAASLVVSVNVDINTPMDDESQQYASRCWF